MKNFVIEIVESYDGYIFRSRHLLKEKNADTIYNMSEKELEYFGHEDSGSEVRVEDMQEVTDIEYNVLKNYL